METLLKIGNQEADWGGRVKDGALLDMDYNEFLFKNPVLYFKFIYIFKTKVNDQSFSRFLRKIIFKSGFQTETLLPVRGKKCKDFAT